MTDAPERIWVKRYPDMAGPITVTFNPENVPSEVEYVRADLYDKAAEGFRLSNERIAALELERDELRKLLFVDRDEWRRFRVHGDTVLALESTAAELARLREAVRKIADDPFLDPEANAAFARSALAEQGEP